ncbi:bifunctional demethylmenaquinone methyltransferase/2-methoxy-6-polyprenyl-1,4-benzoquinol methylase UbiE [Niabella terrae]
MSVQPHDHIIPYETSEKTKKEQVAEMFNSIAGRYDFMNRFLSARIDVTWRNKALKMMRRYQPKQILDIATGTGDMAIRAAKILNPQHITGIDISAQMLEIGRQKVNREQLDSRIRLESGDAENLQFPDNSFDMTMAAFGVRNFENLEKGLKEINRVLAPGGQLLIIEFSKPRIPLVQGIYRLYMQIVAPKIASAFKQNAEAYKYLNASAQAFPERSAFTEILEKTGFKKSSFRPLSLGICCIYRAEK